MYRVDVSYETPTFSPVFALPPLIILSPTSHSWCYPTTSASAFLSFFSPAPPSPSLYCLRILLLFSIHAHTTSTYFCALSWIFLPPWWLHPSILISTTSNFFSCAFFTAHVSGPRTSLLVIQPSSKLSPGYETCLILLIKTRNILNDPMQQMISRKCYRMFIYTVHSSSSRLMPVPGIGDHGSPDFSVGCC